MPFKGYTRCGRCKKMGRENYYPLKLEIIINPKYPMDKKLKVTCKYGHSWVSQSRSANRYVREKESEGKDEKEK